MSDLVVCWRVCVVYKWDKRVVGVATIFLITLFSKCSLRLSRVGGLTFSATVFLCNLTQIGIGFPSVKHLHVLAPSDLKIDIIAFTFSSSINLWATLMIAFRAW